METAKLWFHIRRRASGLTGAIRLTHYLLPAIALLLAGCSAKHYHASADKEAYGAIRQKTPQVRNMDTNFTIDPGPGLTLDSLPASTNAPDFLGPDAHMEQGARVLHLEDALTYG
ncbi:MAG TPA: hypothetical protein VN673_17265, partial [Clostridia bacterium]|nr:hypothetical protein [Clostridia bacterium]